MEPKRTPLWDAHKQLNAKLIDFGGWHMPVSYPAGTIKEHKTVRESVGLFAPTQNRSSIELTMSLASRASDASAETAVRLDA